MLTLYYYEGLNLAEIGEILGVTESRACQIHTKAVLHLRQRLATSSPEPASRSRPPRWEALCPKGRRAIGGRSSNRPFPEVIELDYVQPLGLGRPAAPAGRAAP